MHHLQTTNLQRIRATVDSVDRKQLLMDLNINMRSLDCPYTVTFYGALFREVCLSSKAFGRANFNYCICCWTDITSVRTKISTLHGLTQYKSDQVSAKPDLTFTNVYLNKCQMSDSYNWLCFTALITVAKNHCMILIHFHDLHIYKAALRASFVPVPIHYLLVRKMTTNATEIMHGSQ